MLQEKKRLSSRAYHAARRISKDCEMTKARAQRWHAAVAHAFNSACVDAGQPAADLEYYSRVGSFVDILQRSIMTASNG